MSGHRRGESPSDQRYSPQPPGGGYPNINYLSSPPPALRPLSPNGGDPLLSPLSTPPSRYQTQDDVPDYQLPYQPPAPGRRGTGSDDGSVGPPPSQAPSMAPSVAPSMASTFASNPIDFAKPPAASRYGQRYYGDRMIPAVHGMDDAAAAELEMLHEEELAQARSAYAARTVKEVKYGVRMPLRRDLSLVAVLIALGYLAAMVYYLYVRVAFTLNIPGQKWYSILILVIECLGMTSVIPYALINMVHTHPSGSSGLPPDDGLTNPDKKFNVHVLVPCYKEGLDVISNTIQAVMDASLPPGVRRTVYLCDDGNDSAKAEYMERFGASGVYVTGRQRRKGEINGKSANLNNCLKNVIFSNAIATPGYRPDLISADELIVVFDADMAAKRNFFLKILEVMVDDATALCLTPQGFTNVNPLTDIFNNVNQQFWEFVLPGCDAIGYIACTGTNFCLRAKCLAQVGWFPEYCITEDYALSMELKAAGFKGRYLAEYLAAGEAPEELRNVLRQRSRWTKGHMQVFFSKKCPLFNWRLSLPMKIMYTNGTWSYFTSVITVWTFLLVPFLSMFFGLQPVKFGKEFALAATLYLLSNHMVMNYFHVPSQLQGLFFANISNYLLSFTYMKAIFNTLLSKIHIKKKAGFKATEKTGNSQAAVPLATQLRTRFTSLARRFQGPTQSIPDFYVPPPHVPEPRKPGSGPKTSLEEPCIPEKLVMFFALTVCINTVVLALHQAWVLKAMPAYLGLPMAWCIYNAVPPLLFFGYIFSKDDAMQNIAFYLQLLSSACGVAAVICLWFIPAVI